MRARKLSRRRVLRGAMVGVAIGLPRLEAMLDGRGRAYAGGQPLPRRFGVWAFANGVHLERWVPKQTGSEFELPDELAPLAPVKKDLTVVSGLDLPYDGRSHASGNTVLMTGAKLGGIDDTTYTARRPSIDQLVARQLRGETPLPSIEIGIDDGEAHERGTAFHWWSHTGPSSPNRCEYSCREVFGRLFGDVAAADPGAAAQLVRERQSMLDAVMTDARRLSQGLGRSDRARLEQHLDGIRSIEQRITRRGAVVCKAGKAPEEDLVGPSLGVDYEPRGQQVNRTMAELLALALSCDLTRVFTYQLVKPGSRVAIGSLGFGRYHDITHNEPGDQPRCSATIKLFMRELLVLVETLRAVPEGDGTLLDSCGLLASADCTNPKVHGYKDFPILVFGGAGGRIRTGLHIRGNGENACRVPLSLARATGARIPEFGEENGHLTEGLAALEA
jgi:uncharacterized protein DUF1552